MVKANSHNKKTLEFAVRELKKIFERRNYINGTINCNLVLANLSNMKDKEVASSLSEFSRVIFRLIDEARIIIQTEKRFVLFPMPDIKREAYEIGKKYMKNFLEWIWVSYQSNEERNNFEESIDAPINRISKYTAEELMSILEDELYRLHEMETVLDKMFKNSVN